MTDHRDCRRFFERLSELIDGELDAKTGQEIEAHIMSCPECVVCYSTFKKSVEIFKNLGQEPPPPHFVDRLKEFLEKNS
ncbi:MAG: zf-HC2 domain-containing protein [Pseudomonadota bacterium]